MQKIDFNRKDINGCKIGSIWDNKQSLKQKLYSMVKNLPQGEKAIKDFRNAVRK